jgi:hypothetical protein
MFATNVSICAALILAAAVFSTPAEAQRGKGGGGVHFGGGRVGAGPRGGIYTGSVGPRRYHFGNRHRGYQHAYRHRGYRYGRNIYRAHGVIV